MATHSSILAWRIPMDTDPSCFLSLEPNMEAIVHFMWAAFQMAQHISVIQSAYKYSAGRDYV